MKPDLVRIDISRRSLLSLIAASTGAKSATAAQAAHTHRFEPDNAVNKVENVFFNRHQMDTIATLSELIIPADEHSPGAQAAHADQTIAQILSLSPEKQKKLWMAGLSAIDSMANREFTKPFVDCSAAQQTALLTRISRNEERPITVEERFFVTVKQATVDAYYLSKIGIHQELRYQGNQVLTEFPGCTHEEHRAPIKSGSKR